jgi:hypothetical protein
MAIRLARMLMILVLASLLLPAVAAADGDPASDTLLGENVFYPYAPAVTTSVQRTLNAETAAAQRAGFQIKVALIGSPLDLGVIPSVFGHPQQYANFLDKEISFEGPPHLLVVMAAGYGIQGFGGPAQLAAKALPPPAGKTNTALARAAITAVDRLAAASGHPLNNLRGGPAASTEGAGTGSNAPILIALAAAAVVISAALIMLRRRHVTRPRARVTRRHG